MSLLLPVFLLFCLSSCSGIMDYTCLSDMNPSPGVSLPRGDTEIQVGSNAVNLTCHLNPEHPEYLSGVRAEDLVFQSNLTLLKSTIVNATSIRSTFSPTVEGVTDISCIIRSDHSKSRPLNKGVCTQRILVGHPPLNIADFSCVSDNWLSLNCTWTEPPNPVHTKYDVRWTTPGTWSGFKRCPSISNIQYLLKRSFPPSLRMCYVNYETTPQYRHVTKSYTFYINATNSLTPVGVVYQHTVDHFSVVRPGPARHLTLASQTPDTVQVSWDISREMTHFPPGLRQLVRYASQWAQHWTEVETDNLNTTHDSFSLSLPGPLLPYTLYTVEVSMQTDLPSTPPSLRSTPVQSSIRTRPAPPTRPPRTSLASFEVIVSGAERTVLIYWQMIQPWEQSGPQFAYQVTSVVEEEFPLPLVPVKMTPSYAEFESLTSEKTYSFSIASTNSVGISESAGKVLVPPSSSTTSLLPRSVTKIYEEDDLFTLSWLPPISSANVTSYTLFWCLSSSGQDRPYQCSGQLDWKTITTKQLNGSLSHPLLQPMTDHPNPVFQLAVAANTDTQSSGMQWTTCTVKNARGVSTRVTDVTVDTVSAKDVVVRWRLDCNKMTGLVNSFVVEFCRLGSLGGNCLTGTNQTREVLAGVNKLDIGQLVPNSHYQFTVSVQDVQPSLPGAEHHSKAGPPSPPVTTLTMPAAPGSPPARLSVSKLGRRDATLLWGQPRQPNGQICKYLVKQSTLDQVQGQLVSPHVETQENMLVLTNLTSYTSYLVEVSACTVGRSGSCVLCSSQWARQQFVTMVGTPGRPNTPTVQLVNKTVVEVEWDTMFQLGASAVTLWDLRVGRGEESDQQNSFKSANLVRSGSVTKISVDLEQVRIIEAWGPDCTNSSVYMEYYYFSVRAEVTNSDGDKFVGPWSEDTVQSVYCTPPLPWLFLVLGCTLIPVTALCLCAIVWRSCSWYREKMTMINKIRGGLDSREIAPVVPSANAHGLAEYELGRVQSNPEDYIDSDMDDGQCTVLLRSHKNSSSSSQDSGVSSQAPVSPTRQDSGVDSYTRQDSGVSGVSGYTRQSNSIPSVVSGYISMGAPSAPQSPVSVLGKEELTQSPQQVPGPGYCRVGHLSPVPSSQSYVPFTAIKQVQKENSPGYISLGQISELVLQPDQTSAAYSRVGTVGTRIPGVTRLEEENYSVTVLAAGQDRDIRKAKPPLKSLDISMESSSKELRRSPYSRDFTYV